MNVPRPAMLFLPLLATLPTGCFGSCQPFEEPRFYEESECVAADAPSEPTILVGTTEGAAFTEMSDGEQLLIDYGPQGGQHFYVSARIAGAREDDRLELTLDDEPSARTVSFVPSCGDGWAELQNVTVEVPTDGERSDTLRLRIVRCETEDCDLYGEGFGTSPTVITETTVKISVVLE